MKNSVHVWGLVLAFSLWAATKGATADLVIQSFDRAGQLRFNEVSNAETYRVEWASGPLGPWQTNWPHARLAPTGTGSVTVAVPMCYRVVAVVTNPPPPTGMALVPAGSFTMGDPFGEGDTGEFPRHTATVSAFYMDQYEVTKAQWDEVTIWATANGYSFDNPGSGKATNHPVHAVSWFDCVKWQNARSQKEGLTPAYYTEAGLTMVYKSGQVTPQVNWSANGYRLPTEAEWEKAARGGAAGHRFPWSDADTIAHSRANYWSDFHCTYDVSSTRGNHPTYNDGNMPYTSPVGSFAPNGYGLYDMVGNVKEWCWDWHDYSYYSTSPGTDPRGPTSGSYRMGRGGGWGDDTWYCRTAYRYHGFPSDGISGFGLRSARPANQP